MAAVKSMKQGSTLKQLQEFQERKKYGKRKAGLVQASRFVSVIQNCDALGKELPFVLNTCKDLDGLEKALVAHVAKNSNTKVDSDLRAKVKTRAQRETLLFQQTYDKIDAYSKTLAKNSMVYTVMPMQTFTAAWCATTQHKHGIVIAAPAEGKTLSMLQFARHMITEDETRQTEAVIYCPVEQIAAQTKDKLCMFADVSSKVTVVSRWDPTGWRMNVKNKIFIIDEGEEVIEKRLLDLTKDGFQGLAGLKDFRVFLFTATLTDYYRACWLAAFEMPPEAIRTFPTQQEVKTGIAYQQDVKVSVRRSKLLALQAFLDQIKIRMEN